MVFPVVMYGWGSWTVKKAERWRTDASELWCWRRLLRVPWTARRFNQSILKEISPGISLEGMMLKLKLQYFGHLMWRVDSLEKTLMLEGLGAGGERDDRGWDGWMVSPIWWTWVWVNSGSWWWTGRPGVLIHGVTKSQTRLSNWAELTRTEWISLNPSLGYSPFTRHCARNRGPWEQSKSLWTRSLHSGGEDTHTLNGLTNYILASATSQMCVLTPSSQAIVQQMIM